MSDGNTTAGPNRARISARNLTRPTPVKLTARQLTVYRELVEWVARDGVSRPFVPHVLLNVQCKKSGYSNAVSALVTAGLIQPMLPHAGNGRRQEYRFTGLDLGEITEVESGMSDPTGTGIASGMSDPTGEVGPGMSDPTASGMSDPTLPVPYMSVKESVNDVDESINKSISDSSRAPTREELPDPNEFVEVLRNYALRVGMFKHFTPEREDQANYLFEEFWKFGFDVDRRDAKTIVERVERYNGKQWSYVIKTGYSLLSEYRSTQTAGKET